MPSESPPFTPSSILFRPRLRPACEPEVEAPGTAPGSDGFIPIAVYRHSRHEDDNPNIEMLSGELKGESAVFVFTPVPARQRGEIRRNPVELIVES
jgi:hypothetical protein